MSGDTGVEIDWELDKKKFFQLDQSVRRKYGIILGIGGNLKHTRIWSVYAKRQEGRRVAELQHKKDVQTLEKELKDVRTLKKELKCSKCKKINIKNFTDKTQIKVYLDSLSYSDYLKFLQFVKSYQSIKLLEIQKGLLDQVTHSKTHILYRTDELGQYDKALIEVVSSSKKEGNTIYKYEGLDRTYTASGAVEAMKNKKSPLPEKDLGKVLETFKNLKAGDEPLHIFIMFYGVSGSGKTNRANMCKKVLEKSTNLDQISLFRRKYDPQEVEKLNTNDTIKKNIKKIIEDMTKGKSPIEVKTLKEFNKQRKRVSTPLNEDSSREHTLYQYSHTECKNAKVWLLDLAGAEDYTNRELYKFIKKKKPQNTVQIVSNILPLAKSKVIGLQPEAIRILYMHDVMKDGEFIRTSLEEIKQIWIEYENLMRSKSETKKFMIKPKSSVGETMQNIMLSKLLPAKHKSTHLIITVPNKVESETAKNGVLQSLEFADECTNLITDEYLNSIQNKHKI